MVNLSNLFRRIEECGLTAKKVSAATGISTGNISDWKNGRSMPTAIKLDLLAPLLDCSVDYLLGRTDNPEVNRSPLQITRAARGGGVETQKMSREELAALREKINNLPEETDDL